MAGQIKKLIDTVIELRAKGNPTIALTTKAKITLKGVNPDAYTASSNDDLAILAKVKAIAVELGVALN